MFKGWTYGLVFFEGVVFRIVQGETNTNTAIYISLGEGAFWPYFDTDTDPTPYTGGHFSEASQLSSKLWRTVPLAAIGLWSLVTRHLVSAWHLIFCLPSAK